jgi:type I restriction enzyme, R subunit
MKSQGLDAKPDDVANLKGDDARAAFIKHFKDVQRLQTQLDQYTDLTAEQEATIEKVLPRDELSAFRGVYLETAQRLRSQQHKSGDATNTDLDQLDFELVLFASAMIDYDYIMKLIADFFTQKPGKAMMSRDQLIGLIAGDSKFLNERDDITDYVRSLKAGEGLDEAAIRKGYEKFKDDKASHELTEIADRNGVSAASLGGFVDAILNRRIFDGEKLTELLAPLDLGWKARTQKELALMSDLVPLLKKRAGGREISGLKAYEE